MKVLIYTISFILLFFVAKLRSEQIGQVDIIDFDTLIAEKHLSEGFVVLVAVNEEKAVDVLIRAELFNKLKPLIEEYQPSVKIFAVSDPKFAKKFSFLKLPQIVFYRNGRFIQYKGEINSKKLIEWIDKTSQRRSIELNDANFEHDTQASTGSTTGDWFVLFAKTDCKTAQFIETSWELASLKLENRVLFAYVDYTQNPKLQERFNLNNSPTLIFFKSGLMYRYDFSTFEVDNLVSFVTAAYKNIKSEKVPTEITLFDKVVDEAVTFLKKQKLEKHLNTIYICGISALVLIFALVVYIKCIRTTTKTKKGKYSYESKEYHKLE